MYGYLWRHLPGPTPVKLLCSLLLLLGALALLFYVVFPWVQDVLPFDHTTVGADVGQSAVVRR